MNKLFNAGFVGVVAITLTATATASGPKYTEMGDAGSDPGGSQPTVGNGTLTAINGGLGSSALFGGIDFEDMFLINIVDPMKFRVTTDPADPELMDLNPFCNFNSQLWLFQPTSADPLDALGFLGNDDHPAVPGSLLSLLIPVPTDGSPPLVEAGCYYIAISRSIFFDPKENRNDPVGGDEMNPEEIFNQLIPTEISGPDGPGGMVPISGWTGDKGGAFDGAYRIALRGVEFAVSPCPADFDNSGDVGVKDLLFLLGAWGPCPPKGDCPADFDDSGDVGVKDLLFLLGAWGPCP